MAATGERGGSVGGDDVAIRMARAGGAAAIVGTVFLIAYFTVPSLAGWPYAGGTPDRLIRYVDDHALLFYAGGWLQGVGSALCIVFVLVVVRLAGTAWTLPGLLAIVGSAVLLAVVLAEAVFLIALPAAAAAGDRATVAICFALSNGTFVRIFPLIPAPLVFFGMAYAGGRVLTRALRGAALALAIAFVVVGLLAVFTAVGVYAGIALSVLQAVWFLWAGIAVFARARALREGR
ncbi:hypothetical protein [Leifsonia shinshuensis]